jgi:hypothetical protein
MKKSNNESSTLKIEKVKNARHLYTYEGLLSQIEKWFFDPFGPEGGYLKCKNDYKKEKMYMGMII